MAGVLQATGGGVHLEHAAAGLEEVAGVVVGVEAWVCLCGGGEWWVRKIGR